MNTSIPVSTQAMLEQFADQGFVVIPGFLSAADCEHLYRAIIHYSESTEITQVRWRDSTFDTFNSNAVEDNFPEINSMYENSALELVRRLAPHVTTINERRVGLTVNVTSREGKFQPHFDRHMMTAVLYLNDDFEGGSMRLFPRLRFWLGHPGGAFKRKIQRVLDRTVRSRAYLAHIAREKLFQPRAGDLLVFEGTKTYHAVTQVMAGGPRVTIQFAYDLPGVSYDLSAYYGR